MIDPAGVTQRGAERSAPRSRSGPSASDSHGIARADARLVATRTAEAAVVTFHGNPPDAGREVQRRTAIAERGALDLLSSRSCGTVERGAQVDDGIGMTAREIRRVSAELSAQRRCAAASPVPCLTSAGGDRDTAHEGFVLAGVLACASVGSRQGPRVAVERVARALEGGIQ
jgi:hypothetical protein